MVIDKHVEELLLRPLLKRELEIPVDDFKLESASGPVALGATVVCEERDSNLRIELRDAAGRKLSQFFTSKTEIGKDELSIGSGAVGGKLKVQLSGIRPPHSDTTTPIGAVRYSSGIAHFERIQILSEGTDQFSEQELVSLLGDGEPGKSDLAVEPEDNSSEKESIFEHLAVFANCKLAFQNSQIVRTVAHDFWGKTSKSELISWDGKAFGGDFSIMMDDEHLKVGFRHQAYNLEESKRCAQSLFAAIGYTHAINPWPSYLKVAVGGRVLEEHLRHVVQTQGKYTPLRRHHGAGTPSAPTDLIASVAQWLKGLSENDRNDIDHAFWIFRGADNRNVPIPAKLAMIGGVIEGLFSASDSTNPPEAFTTLQSDAVKWAGDIESTETNADRATFARRLVGYLKGWSFRDRRVAWRETFLPLFPGHERWLDEVFGLYQKHRHPSAHGDFAAAMAGDGIELIQAVGKLSGFVNLVVAAKAGYKGPILESTSSDSVFQLK